MPSSSALAMLDKARRTLDAARSSLAGADTEGACNRAYYAMFYAANAALWAVGAHPDGAVVKTHTGMLSLVAQHLVKSGILDHEHGRALANVQKARLLADYTADPPTIDDATDALARAEVFIEVVASLSS